MKLTGDVPTISFRDLAIQRRENDLVGASFGRGLLRARRLRALREIDEAALEREALLFPTRRAWWYIERQPLGDDGRGSQGASYFIAPNPPFGAVFTYYLSEELKSRKEARQEAEKPPERSRRGHSVSRLGRGRSRASRDRAEDPSHGERQRR